MTVTESLKRFRNTFRLTQKQVADLLNMSQQSYYYYENKGGLSAENIVKLADTYDVSTDYLLGRSDNTKNNSVTMTEEDLKTIAKALNQSSQALQKILENLSGK